LDIWAPALMSQGVPRTHVESLYVRVTTGRGVVGWGEFFGTGRAMVVASFDNWIGRLAVGQSASDKELIPRIERMLLSLSRSGPLDVCRFRRDSIRQDCACDRGGVEVPQGPGLGADPEDDLIARFQV
jgi:L-alanine-DL-glutamate epimerase-like enolase superfamily enzyme